MARRKAKHQAGGNGPDQSDDPKSDAPVSIEERIRQGRRQRAQQKKAKGSSSSSKKTSSSLPSSWDEYRPLFLPALLLGLSIVTSILFDRYKYSSTSSSENLLALHRPVADDEWNLTHPALARTHAYLSTYVCSHPRGYCHPNLVPVPVRRTHKAADVASEDSSKKSKSKSSSSSSGGGIKPGAVVLIVPRELQIWDLDALRDPWVRRRLLGARHANTGNPLDSGAYLAADLARTVRLASLAQRVDGRGGSGGGSSSEEENENEGDADAAATDGDTIISDDNDSVTTTDNNDVLAKLSRAHAEAVAVRDAVAPYLPYLAALPSYGALSRTHPALWPRDAARALLGRYTPAATLVGAYADMIRSEYDALAGRAALTAAVAPATGGRDGGTGTNEDFTELVSREEYAAMRINVMSRSFGPGPPTSPEEEEQEQEESGHGDHGDDDDALYYSLEEELEYYRSVAGVDLSAGCRSMSPILDAYDHHAAPNAVWHYDVDKRAFVVRAGKDGIPPGHDVMVSYGRYTDTHLFAKFGFVNGDGSGLTDASVASLHRLQDAGMGGQFAYLPLELVAGRSGGEGGGGGGRGEEAVEDAAEEAAERADDPRLEERVLASIAAEGRELARYLQFDDGYSACIVPPDDDDDPDEKGEDGADEDGDAAAAVAAAWALKKLKWRHLREIAHDRSRWVVTFPPLHPESQPAFGSDVPIAPPQESSESESTDSKMPKFDASGVVSTCRLLALTVHDLDGRAAEVLEATLRNDTARDLKIGRWNTEQDDSDDGDGDTSKVAAARGFALEYRALSCLVRLADLMLYRYPAASVKEDAGRLRDPLPAASSADAALSPPLGVTDGPDGPPPAVHFGSAEWHALHVRLGEKRSLEALRGVAASGTRKMREKALELAAAGGGGGGKSGSSAWLEEEGSLVVRRKPCELELTMKLVE